MEIKMLDQLDAMGIDQVERYAGSLKVKCGVCGRGAKIRSRVSCRKFMKLTGWRDIHRLHDGSDGPGWTCPKCALKYNTGEIIA